jgi:hypothetical protein
LDLESGNNPWLIKGVIDTQVNVNYDSTGIKEYTDILNMTLNWDTEAESVKRVSDHVYFKVLNELASTEEFNKELYGVEDLGVTNYTGTVALYTREVKLDHGWRRVYCGRRYRTAIPEVERTITDSYTYKHLREAFQGGC